jgi:tetratricopeptide (TPR) repeat protein
MPMVAAVLLLAASSRAHAAASGPADPVAPLAAAMAEAEASLREGELQIAESRYRGALLEGWLLLGSLEAADGRLGEAREAFRRASTAAVETRRALQSLALVELQLGEASEAVGILTQVVARNPKDGRLRQLLAQALAASGRPEEAAQELEEARAAAADDLELGFLLATEYLRLQKPEQAASLFARIAAARPIPQTQVLIGRAYRDFGAYDRARVALRQALALDPRARRAHYYLGMVEVLDRGADGLPDAIREFQEETRLAPRDPLAHLRLGMALVEDHRAAEALPSLEIAAPSDPPTVDAFHYLGRALLALDRPSDAVVPLRRALELARIDMQLGSIHYQLALALRALGEDEEASSHFAESQRYSTERALGSRERLSRYLAGEVEAGLDTAPTSPLVQGAQLSGLTPAEREDTRRRTRTGLARAYLNLGVMQARSEAFPRAADDFALAAECDPALEQVQYSLGVARFNAGQFEAAKVPLARALTEAPADPALSRMLALASFNTEDYAKAAELLGQDPERGNDASLQFTYATALVRSGHARDAEAIFKRLLAEHGESAELSVVLGQAHAQEGDYAAAETALARALQLKPGVKEANATLGVIYLKQGRLAEAEGALRAELRSQPSDVKSKANLATVLDLEGKPQEALPLLRDALKQQPEFADGRYLLGKLLLAQGSTQEAVEHLEAAVRLAPGDANIRFQLAQAYQKLGQRERADVELAAYRKIKDEHRGTP